MEQDQDQVGSYTVAIDREFVTSAKKIANFNEFSEIKKIRTKICYVPEWKLTVTQQDEKVSI